MGGKKNADDAERVNVFRNDVFKRKRSKPICQYFKNSFVCVLDIMGFSQFLNNNSSAVGMLKAHLLVTECLKAARTSGQYHSRKTHLNVFPKIQKRIVTYQFSDTIIYVLPVDDGMAYFDFWGFAEMVAWGVRSCFDLGLPVQGFVSFGDCSYNCRENFFVGKPFINAHEQAEKLDFSGVVVGDDVINAIRADTSAKALKAGKIDFDKAMMDSGVVTVYAPVKDVGYVSLCCLDWMHSGVSNEFRGCDMRQLLVAKFSAHDKPITGRVVQKIENTELVLRQILARTSNAI